MPTCDPFWFYLAGAIGFTLGVLAVCICGMARDLEAD